MFCKKCGYDLNDFISTGFLGCDACYDTFRNELEIVIRRMHGKTRHIGKLPIGNNKLYSLQREYQRLFEEKEKAKNRDDFDTARELLSKLKSLELELKKAEEQNE